MRISCGILGLLLAGFLLVGCGSGGNADEGTTAATTATRPQLRKLRVTLDDLEGAENVGIVMAVKQGYFKDVGLDVWAGSPIEPRRSLQYVAKGIDDLGVTQQPQIVIGKEKGAPVVAVGSLVSRPTAAMIWLKGSGIHGIADLKGKTIVTPGVPFQKGFLQKVLARGGLTLEDVTVKGIGYDLTTALINGEADAIFGGSWDLEGVELELRNKEPVIKRVQDLGIPPYEEAVVIARSDLVRSDPKLIRDFMSAVARGTAAAVAHPGAASVAIKEGIGANPDLHRKDRAAQLKVTLPLLSKSAYMSPARARNLVDWMKKEGMIKRPWPPRALLTNAYR
jgi:putative hydroxymethylpyrimidine transport system substrate-binding protein